MTWKVTTDPEYLPLTLDEAKAYLRVQHASEDSTITDCIRAATSYCEEELDLAIMEQQITLKMDAFPVGAIKLPRTNLLSVTSVSYIDTNGDSQAFTDFTVDDFSSPARIVANEAWPDAKSITNAVTIVYQAGFKSDQSGSAAENPAPGAVMQAMRLLITHYFDNRNTVVIGSGIAGSEVALTVTALLQKFRRLGI
jgi:uncharacterized phiE125 gp8 family phage protein